jgi:hypothetical protein
MQSEEQPTSVVVLSPESAARTLRERFGAFVDADYLQGKTAMRDALCEQLELSLLEAEELCDSLEASNVLRFVRTPDGVGWHIHDDMLDEAA